MEYLYANIYVVRECQAQLELECKETDYIMSFIGRIIGNVFFTRNILLKKAE